MICLLFDCAKTELGLDLSHFPAHMVDHETETHDYKGTAAKGGLRQSLSLPAFDFAVGGNRHQPSDMVSPGAADAESASAHAAASGGAA
jgi:hypothetical protein